MGFGLRVIEIGVPVELLVDVPLAVVGLGLCVIAGCEPVEVLDVVPLVILGFGLTVKLADEMVEPVLLGLAVPVCVVGFGLVVMLLDVTPVVLVVVEPAVVLSAAAVSDEVVQVPLEELWLTRLRTGLPATPLVVVTVEFHFVVRVTRAFLPELQLQLVCVLVPPSPGTAKAVLPDVPQTYCWVSVFGVTAVVTVGVQEVGCEYV